MFAASGTARDAVERDAERKYGERGEDAEPEVGACEALCDLVPQSGRADETADDDDGEDHDDPLVDAQHGGWAKAASLLRAKGTIAILQPVRVRDDPSLVHDELDALWARVAPELSAERPPPRDESTIRADFEERRDNVSEAWSSLTHRGLGIPEAAELFGPARLTAVRRVQERTAAEIWAVFETTSRFHRLSPAAREEIEAESERIVDRHGGTLRTTQLVALVTAQRRSAV